MFCPKCGIENPDNGKFCRKCGNDLKVISDVMSGKLTVSDPSRIKKKKKEATYTASLTLLFISFAFFTISAILAFQPMGAYWWFWLLIPAFATLANGIGQAIALKQNKETNIKIVSDENVSLPESEMEKTLSPKKPDFIVDFPETKYQTGDLVPLSVVDETTRKLEMNSEGETMNLQKDNK